MNFTNYIDGLFPNKWNMMEFLNSQLVNIKRTTLLKNSIHD